MISSQTFQNDSHQDWQTVVIRKRQPKWDSSEKSVNAARRNDIAIDTIRKQKHGGNASINKAKLDQETEDFHLKKVPMDIAKSIEKGRIAKKLSRDDLAKALSIPAQEINEIERGQALYNGERLAKIKRYLGIS